MGSELSNSIKECFNRARNWLISLDGSPIREGSTDAAGVTQ